MRLRGKTSDNRRSGGCIIYKWKLFDLPGILNCGRRLGLGFGSGMLMGALVGVGVAMVLGIGMLMGVLIGVELDVISGVYAFVGAVMISGIGMPVSMLVGVGVDMMVCND